MQRLRLREGAAYDDGAELAAERFVDLLEEATAESEAGLIFREGFIDRDEGVEDFSFSAWQRVETRLQTLLEIFEDERDETYVGDFVLGEGFADVFGA